MLHRQELSHWQRQRAKLLRGDGTACVGMWIGEGGVRARNARLCAAWLRLWEAHHRVGGSKCTSQGSSNCLACTSTNTVHAR